MKIVLFSGGGGGAKLAQGLASCLPAGALTVVVNTGDDFLWYGLPVSPDLDTVLYTLSGQASPETGWGVAGDSFQALNALANLGEEPWFRLGDRDLALQLLRGELLRKGLPLSAVTALIARRLGITAQVLPMSDQPVRTVIVSGEVRLPFQTYFVRRRCQDPVEEIVLEGLEEALPAPGVLQSIRGADAVILAPSNPFVSIGPILALPGVRSALEETKAKVAAISPIVAGAALKGPAAEMLKDLDMEPSALGVCRLYRGLLDLFVADSRDAGLAPRFEDAGVQVRFCDTFMGDLTRRKALARAMLAFLETL